jgi:hypothetical protein
MSQSTEEKELVVNINYKMFVLALVVMSLVNWVLVLLMRPTAAQAQVLWIMNVGLSAFLLLDFAYRVWAHPQRRLFMGRRGGWLILLGSLPLPFAGVFRLIWSWLAMRRLRSSDFRQMSKIVVQRHAQSTLLTALLAAVTSGLHGGFAALHIDVTNLQRAQLRGAQTRVEEDQDQRLIAMHVDPAHGVGAAQERVGGAAERAGFQQRLDLFFSEGLDRHLLELRGGDTFQWVGQIQFTTGPGVERRQEHIDVANRLVREGAIGARDPVRLVVGAQPDQKFAQGVSRDLMEGHVAGVLQPDPKEVAVAAEGAGAETFRGFVLQKAFAGLRDE